MNKRLVIVLAAAVELTSSAALALCGAEYKHSPEKADYEVACQKIAANE